mmetsp:Transcript_68923/g.109368  ORF Transcript_68923/g.109368 Transcript_68923/m.109368 type:complete len:206 (+) Transcript_68923:670-1287(+)
MGFRAFLGIQHSFRLLEVPQHLAEEISPSWIRFASSTALHPLSLPRLRGARSGPLFILLFLVVFVIVFFVVIGLLLFVVLLGFPVFFLILLLLLLIFVIFVVLFIFLLLVIVDCCLPIMFLAFLLVFPIFGAVSLARLVRTSRRCRRCCICRISSRVVLAKYSFRVRLQSSDVIFHLNFFALHIRDLPFDFSLGHVIIPLRHLRP